MIVIHLPSAKTTNTCCLTGEICPARYITWGHREDNVLVFRLFCRLRWHQMSQDVRLSVHPSVCPSISPSDRSYLLFGRNSVAWLHPSGITVLSDQISDFKSRWFWLEAKTSWILHIRWKTADPFDAVCDDCDKNSARKISLPSS